MRWLLISQNIILFASGMVFPYYVIFIKESGATYVTFGFAYGLFAISSAIAHYGAGKLVDAYGKSIFLAFSSWGMAFSLVFFPSVVSMYQVFILQIVMGICNAFQKTSEKALVADMTLPEARGQQIGTYHMWTAIFSALAVIAAGYTIDILSLDVIFYVASLCMFIGGFVSLWINEGTK
jgi:MFS family permease